MKFLIALLLSMSSVYAKDITLTSDNTVSLRGPVTGDSIGEVMSELKTLSEKGEDAKPIYLVLNTPGGSVLAGINLMQYMNTLRRPVHVVANFAASMGFHILQTSKVRYVTKYGTIMSHRASGGFEGDIPQQVNSRLKHIVDLTTEMDKQVVSRTKGKISLKAYQELIRDEYWAVGTSSIKDGFADEIATLSCDDSLNGTVTKTFNAGFFVAEVEMAKCPLIMQVTAKKPEEYSKVMSYLNGLRKLEF
jgi:ATP-dependent Clp protease protease subunit